MRDQVVRETPRAGRTGTSLLRVVVLLLALAELAAAAYVWYALFVDDTTAWLTTVVPEAGDLWQALVLPCALGGALALVLGLADRLLLMGLAIALAAPVVSGVWLFG